MADATQGRELALTIINTGEGYEDRCAIARVTRMPRLQATNWLSVAHRGARRYEREFPGAKFSAVDILACAAELADYYAQHVAETDRLGE
jgi:hypothetical protein